jgi:DNA-binding MarR family transcriptional regulator
VPRPKRPGNETALADSIERISFGLVAVTALAIDAATSDHTLTFQQWRALVVLARASDGRRITELATRTGASRPSTSRLVRRLEARGWIVVAPDPTDGRAVRLLLSPAGMNLHRRVLERRRELIEETIVGEAVSLDAGLDIARLAELFERWV